MAFWWLYSFKSIPENLFILYFYIIMGSVTFSLLGILVGIFCKKFDQMSAVNNFIIAPFRFFQEPFIR